LSDNSFRNNAKQIGDSFDKTGGVALAIDSIEEVPNFYEKRQASKASAVINQRMEEIDGALKKAFADFSDIFSSEPDVLSPPTSPVTSPRGSSFSKVSDFFQIHNSQTAAHLPPKQTSFSLLLRQRKQKSNFSSLRSEVVYTI